MRYTYEEILRQMKNSYQDTCNLNVTDDSDDDKKIKALATELFSLSCFGDYIMKQAFVDTADGEHLDRHGELRGCTRKEGGRAEGMISFGVRELLDHDVFIKAATVCSVAGSPHLQYETLEDCYLFAGFGEVIVPARALGCGEEYNVDIGEINAMVNVPAAIDGVSNVTPFTGGYSGESDSSYRKRIKAAYTNPSLYMCKEEIRSRVLQIKNVIDCSISDYSTPGVISVVVRTTTNTISQADMFRITEYIGVDKLFGMTLNISCASAEDTDVSLSIKVSHGADRELLSQQITDYVCDYLNGSRIGENMPVAPLYKYIYGLDGVEKLDIYSDKLGSEAFLCNSKKYIVPGEVVVEFYE